MPARSVQRNAPRGMASIVIAALITGSLFGTEQESLGELESALRSAVTGGHVQAAIRTMDDLVALRSVEAYRAIIEHALTGARYENYPIERRAGALLAATTDQRVRDEVYRQLEENRNYKTRIILLAVVRRYAADDPKAFTALAGALRDSSMPVVLTALEHIAKLGREARPCVEPMIDLLEMIDKKHMRNRLYFDTRKTLRVVTGVDLEVAEDWRNFWAAYKDGKPLPKRREGRTEVVLPGFFSVGIDSDRLFFCIDVSSSMEIKDPEPLRVTSEAGRGPDVDAEERGQTTVGGPGGPSGRSPPRGQGGEPPADRMRIRRAQSELVKLIEKLPDATRFGILSFSHEIHFWEGSKVLRPATALNKASATRWVNALRPMGATRTDLALVEALTIPDVDTIFVLTDGAPKNIQNQRLDIEPILQFANTQNRFLRAKVHTVSFSQIRDTRMKTFVEKLAFDNGGKCTWLD